MVWSKIYMRKRNTSSFEQRCVRFVRFVRFAGMLDLSDLSISAIKIRKTDQRTDGPTYGGTDPRTDASKKRSARLPSMALPNVRD